VFAESDAARVLRELDDVIHGLDLTALLASSKPPTFVHIARPLPAGSSGAWLGGRASSASYASPNTTPVLRTILPAALSPVPSSAPYSSPAAAAAAAAALASSYGAAGEKRRRDSYYHHEGGSSSSASLAPPSSFLTSGGGSGSGSGGLAEVLSLLGSIRGEVAGLSARMAALEEGSGSSAARRY
jgi:hypothetical protein